MEKKIIPTVINEELDHQRKGRYEKEIEGNTAFLTMPITKS